MPKKKRAPKAKNLVRDLKPMLDQPPENPKSEYPASLNKYVRLADVALGKKIKD